MDSDGAVLHRWLDVTVLAPVRTGLAAPDVFSFGNLAGDTGDATPGAAGAAVTVLDLMRVRGHLSSSPVPLSNPYDFNRDGRVNALDIAAVKGNLTRALLPIRPPAEPAVTPGPAATLLVLAEDDEGAPAPPPAVAT